ncbi:MAG: GRAS family protein [Pseudomonadota bacterium]
MNNCIDSIWNHEWRRVDGFHHPVADAIKRHAQALDGKDTAQAAACIAQARALLVPAPTGAAPSYLERFFGVFLDALEGRPASAGNSYRENDMLEAFYAFYRQAPLVRFGHDAANTFIRTHTEDAPRLVILDIGFGNGMQWEQLFELAHKDIELIGIDLPTSNNARAFEQFAQRVAGTHIRFTPVLKAVEDIDFKALMPQQAGYTIVNASLALHHILPDELQADGGRQHVLAQIQALRPDLFVLVEPDSDHNNLSAGATIVEAMAHYMTVFQTLDHFLGDSAQLGVIESAFFGREMHNILGHLDAQRYERHERHAQWAQRLQRLGFHELGRHQYAWQHKPLLVASAWKLAA